MSLKRRKAGLVISWQRSLSILAPWRKGKGERNVVLDSDVVLTKMKLLNNFSEKLLMAADPASTVSTASVSDPSKVNTQVEEQPLAVPGSPYSHAIFADSCLTRLYKFESEDSGVELPSGANSPSTPPGSEKSFVVHSRESSCDSCHLDSDSTSPPNTPHTDEQNSTVETQDSVFADEPSCEPVTLFICEDLEETEASGLSSGTVTHRSEQCGQIFSLSGENSSESRTLTEESVTTQRQENTAMESITTSDTSGRSDIRRDEARDSLEDYMDHCCRLSQAQPRRPGPLGSGLGYLEHICRLLEKIGHLQEANLRLQRQLCALQQDGRTAATKEEFFQQYCSCGAAILAFQAKSDILSPSGTFSDLSTIPEVSRLPLMSPRRGTSGKDLSAVPEWRRSRVRRSYAEGELRLHGDSSEGRSPPLGRLAESFMWARVKDLVRKTKARNQSRLVLTSASLKMSCPQLYRPDEEQEESRGRSRNSMIGLSHQNKPQLSWL